MIPSEILNKAKQYRKHVTDNYKLINISEVDRLQCETLQCSVKYDGQLFFLYNDNARCILFNTNGKVYDILPLLDETREVFGYKKLLFVGELYDSQSDRPRNYDINKKDTLHAFGVFDVLIGDESIVERLNVVNGLVHAIPQHALKPNDLVNFYDNWVNDLGFEGVVAKDLKNHAIYKIKPKHTIDAVIVGYVGDNNEQTSYLLALQHYDGSYQVIGSVKNTDYHILFSEVKSEFKTTDSSHTLYTMVNPTCSIILEISFNDIITGTKRPNIIFDSKHKIYSPIGKTPLVSLIGANIVRERQDKNCLSQIDIRATQLNEFVDFDALTVPTFIKQNESTILDREVYTKTTKGNLCVKKFYIWKTNKEGYPPFVFLYTDYSPKRAEPLVRTLECGSNYDTVKSILDNYKAREIKRGWTNA